MPEFYGSLPDFAFIDPTRVELFHAIEQPRNPFIDVTRWPRIDGRVNDNTYGAAKPIANLQEAFADQAVRRAGGFQYIERTNIWGITAPFSTPRVGTNAFLTLSREAGHRHFRSSEVRRFPRP